ncbi:hypothetical protein PENTCL1PPCAC_29329, partial [Pristionchus entomophagus]
GFFWSNVLHTAHGYARSADGHHHHQRRSGVAVAVVRRRRRWMTGNEGAPPSLPSLPSTADPDGVDDWVGPTAPLPIIVPEDKLPKQIRYRREELAAYTFSHETMVAFYYHVGEQMNGKLELREGECVLYQLPEPKQPEPPKNAFFDIEDEETDEEKEARLKAEGMCLDLMEMFWMDEELGIASSRYESETEGFEAPVEMREEQMGIIPYEDLIPAGVRSRRSGNERVHPSELRTAHGESQRTRRERDLFFALELSDADDEAEDEEEEE